MATSKKLEIIYHNGQPDGIRSIRRHLSTMTTYVIPRRVYGGDKFQVFEGSEVNLEKPVHLEKYNRQRKELYEKGDIVKQEDKYILTVTLEFNTPSGASDFVLGGSTNGWSEWKNKDGKTLDEVYRK